MTEPVPASAFTDALSLAANGVSIVTTDGASGKAGLTVSSMCSVCADPAIVLACVNADNEFCAAADANAVFAVNILTTEQIDISNVFAGITELDSDACRFEQGEWKTLNTGSPILERALVTLDCEQLWARTEGTHRIYVGRVVALDQHHSTPLVYTRRSYARSNPI